MKLRYAHLEEPDSDLAVEIEYEGKLYGGYIPKLAIRRNLNAPCGYSGLPRNRDPSAHPPSAVKEGKCPWCGPITRVS